MVLYSTLTYYVFLISLSLYSIFGTKSDSRPGDKTAEKPVVNRGLCSRIRFA